MNKKYNCNNLLPEMTLDSRVAQGNEQCANLLAEYFSTAFTNESALAYGGTWRAWGNLFFWSYTKMAQWFDT